MCGSLQSGNTGREQCSLERILRMHMSIMRKCDHDHFHMTHPDTEWKSCIEHAVKIGLGTNEYDLETI